MIPQSRKLAFASFKDPVVAMMWVALVCIVLVGPAAATGIARAGCFSSECHCEDDVCVSCIASGHIPNRVEGGNEPACITKENCVRNKHGMIGTEQRSDGGSFKVCVPPSCPTGDDAIKNCAACAQRIDEDGELHTYCTFCTPPYILNQVKPDVAPYEACLENEDKCKQADGVLTSTQLCENACTDRVLEQGCQYCDTEQGVRNEDCLSCSRSTSICLNKVTTTLGQNGPACLGNCWDIGGQIRYITLSNHIVVGCECINSCTDKEMQNGCIGCYSQYGDDPYRCGICATRDLIPSRLGKGNICVTREECRSNGGIIKEEDDGEVCRVPRCSESACASCTDESPGSCTKCDSGYYLNKLREYDWGECLAQEGCEGADEGGIATTENEIDVCIPSCSDRLYDMGCQTCGKSEDGKDVCTKCKVGYYRVVSSNSHLKDLDELTDLCVSPYECEQLHASVADRYGGPLSPNQYPPEYENGLCVDMNGCMQGQPECAECKRSGYPYSYNDYCASCGSALIDETGKSAAPLYGVTCISWDDCRALGSGYSIGKSSDPMADSQACVRNKSLSVGAIVGIAVAAVVVVTVVVALCIYFLVCRKRKQRSAV